MDGDVTSTPAVGLATGHAGMDGHVTPPPLDGAQDSMIHAAGTVLWRPGDEGPEVAVIHRPRKKDWSFPKGKLRSGETVREAAIRETREETGMTPAFGSPLPPRRYVKGWRLKRVDYWAATVAGPAEFVPNHEVDRLEWLSLPAARRRLTHARDRRLLDAFATAAPEIR